MTDMLFITGTDTNVGKTLVTASLLLALLERGIRCAPVKPVQSGAAQGDDDIRFCLSFAQPPFAADDHQRLCLHRLPLPASPHLAAREAGADLSVHALGKQIRALSREWKVLLIEGAGGLLVPYNERETTIDLIKALSARPVVVARDSLGTLNHTALTLRVLADEGITPAAVVVTSCPDPVNETDRQIREDNIREITRRAAPIPVVHFPYMPVITRESLVAAGHLLADQIERW